MCESTEADAATPVACSLSAADLSNRGERWRRLGSRAGVSASRTADGLSLAFKSQAGVKEELTELARLERECCAFAAWTLDNNGDQLILEVTAHDEQGVRAVHDMHDAFTAALARP